MLRAYVAAGFNPSPHGLARTLGVSPEALSAWAHGIGRPDVGHALLLAHYAAIPMGAWLTEDERLRLLEAGVVV